VSRAIKFRQWCGKRFEYWGIGIDGNTFVGPCSGGGLRADETPHQQFTGLLDKNGKEIYEGDLIQHPMWAGPNNIGIFSVEYIDGAFYRVPTTERNRMALLSNSCGPLGSGELVIGTIHENADLLHAPIPLIREAAKGEHGK